MPFRAIYTSTTCIDRYIYVYIHRGEEEEIEEGDPFWRSSVGFIVRPGYTRWPLTKRLPVTPLLAARFLFIDLSSLRCASSLALRDQR